MICVAIGDDDVMKTAEILPRSTDAGFVVVNLKRSLDLKSCHDKAYLDTNEIYDCLLHLIKIHPSYRFMRKKSKEDWEKEVIFNLDTIPEEDEQGNEASLSKNQGKSADEIKADEKAKAISKGEIYADTDTSSESSSSSSSSPPSSSSSSSNASSEITTESSSTQKRRKKQKKQKKLKKLKKQKKKKSSERSAEDNIFNSITCLQPEDLASTIHFNDTGQTVKKKLRRKNKKSISIAPGQGKIPSNFLRDKDFDINAYPHLHPRGRFGLHYERPKKISAGTYAGRQMMHMNDMWASDETWPFAFQQFVQRSICENSIDCQMKRGKVVKNPDGTKKITNPEDSFSIFKKVVNSPAYWKQYRYEILARIEQLE